MNAVWLAAGSFALCGVLSAWLARSRLADRAEAAPARKLQRVPVPRVGGLALHALACCALDGTHSLALSIALVVGGIDDLVSGGLPAGGKLLLQLCGALAIAAIWPAASWWHVPLIVVAFNLANTFDNSDGALLSLSCLGAALCGARELVALTGGVLPWNTALRRDSSAPRAYLGDSGSHWLGAWIALDPRLWPLLWLPALDLAWVCVLRVRARVPPWKGDRSHLAQALERRGWGLMARLALLLGIALPPLLLPLQIGLAASLCAYIGGRILAREQGAPDNPRPPIP